MPSKKISRVNDIIIGEEAAEQASQGAAARVKATEDLGNFFRGQTPADLIRLMSDARRQRGWLYTTLALVVLLVVTLLGFFVFGGAGGTAKFGEEAVQFAVVGPENVPSGQSIDIVVNYSNNQGVGLKDIELNMRYPVGFIFQNADPVAFNTEGSRFTIPSVSAHGSGRITIRGQLVGEVGEQKEFTGFVSYQPANITAQFAKTIKYHTSIVASVLRLTVTGPTQLPLDQSLPIDVAYKNSSTDYLSGLVLQLTLPTGFELETPALEAVANTTNVWKLNNLPAKGAGAFTFRGKFTATANPGAQAITVAVGILGSDGKTVNVQETKALAVTVIKSHLLLELKANDATTASTADVGQELVYQLAFTNEGDVPFSNIVLQAKLPTPWFDWSTFKDDTGGASVDQVNGTITWTKSASPLLDTLIGGGQGKLKFRLRTVAVLPAGITSVPSFSVRVTAQGQELVNGSLQSLTAESNEVITKVNTKLSLEAEARYYTDQMVKLGSGPLPLRVGQTTTYVVFWRLGNTWNEVENIEVITTLPQGVTWTGQTTVTAGQTATYNPNTREVRWRLNRLPVGAGTAFTRPEASFEVAVTPEENDVYKILVLAKTTTATARDTWSGADLIATAKLLTTDLDDDLGAQGKGVVGR